MSAKAFASAKCRSWAGDEVVEDSENCHSQTMLSRCLRPCRKLSFDGREACRLRSC